MARTDYTVEIVDCTKELTHKEESQLKDLTFCQSLNEIVQQQAIVVKPTMLATLKVHNEHSKNKDYTVYVIVDENGDRYKTGSESFYGSVCDIITDMSDTDEEWAINIYTRPSKNYSDKSFITCSIV